MSKSDSKHHEQEHAHDHDDDLIVVPKGQSKTRFYLTMGLMLFMVLIFMITGPMMATLSGGSGGGGTYMSWDHPSKGRTSVSDAEFYRTKRKLARFQRALFGRGGNPADTEVGYWLMMKELAADAGVRATDENVRGLLKQRFPDTQLYTETLAGMNLTPREFEEMLRTHLSLSYYKSWITEAATHPDPVKVQERWTNKNQEYAFDYVALKVEDMHDEARASLPEDETERATELKAWFDGLTDAQRNQYQIPEKRKAKLAWFDLPIENAEAAAVLMEQFPRPEFEEAADIQDNYFSSYQFTRFRREEPLEVDPNAADQRQAMFDANYYKREEVEEQVAVEAPIFQSLLDWEKSVTERTEAEEELDLLAEAAGFGMATLGDDKPRTREEWQNFPEKDKGRWLASEIFRAQPGATKVVLEPGRMYVIHVTEIIPPSMPEFADITEEIEEDWVAANAKDLAVEKLDALRNGFDGGPVEGEPFRPQVDRDTFVLACKTAGLTVENRDWSRREFPLTAESTPEDRYFRFTESLYTLRVNGVAAPAVSQDGSTVYLVRQAGIRDPDPESMLPAELAAARTEVAQEVRQDFEEKNLNSPSYFVQNYGYEAVYLNDV